MDEHTFVGYYVSWIVQFMGGLDYLILFGVILTMEMEFCQFISICSNDLKKICSETNEGNLNNSEFTKKKLKEGIQLHEEILK